MKASMKLFATFLLLLICLTATEMGGPIVAVEGRTCLSQSHKFKGACLSDTNCGNVCKTEGFPRGKCRGFRRRCFCTRHC